MADTFGNLEIPVAATTPAGDPALRKVGEFLQAVINRYAGTAWATARPRAGDEALPVRFVFTHEPKRESFNDKHLPALFVYRESGTHGFEAIQRWNEDSQWKALWVLPSDKQSLLALRDPFVNAIEKIVRVTLSTGLDSSWVDEDDEDPLAASVAADADSIKLAIATSTLAQTFSGADLNGVRAGDTFAPRLQPTITTALVSAFDDPGVPDAGDEEAGSTDVYNTADPIVWTVVDWYGRTTTRSKYLTLPLGGETVGPPEDVKSIVDVTIPPQLSTLGTLELGTGPFIGRGSDLKVLAGLTRVELSQWRRANVEIDVLNEEQRIERKLIYPALELSLSVAEMFEIDLEDSSRFHPISAGAGVDVDAIQSDQFAPRGEF